MTSFGLFAAIIAIVAIFVFLFSNAGFRRCCCFSFLLLAFVAGCFL